MVASPLSSPISNQHASTDSAESCSWGAAPPLTSFCFLRSQSGAQPSIRHRPGNNRLPISLNLADSFLLDFHGFIQRFNPATNALCLHYYLRVGARKGFPAIGQLYLHQRVHSCVEFPSFVMTNWSSFSAPASIAISQRERCRH